MNQRLLLGSTALVGAGILLAGATAPARADMTVTLSGYTEFGVRAATDDTNNPAPDQGYNAYMDTEIHVQAEATSDSGIKYGSYVALDLYRDENVDGSGVNTDEADIFFAGGFGRVELGRNDGVEDVMFVGAEDAQSGTGGIDGDTTNLATTYHLSNGDSAKAIYYTPRVGGFQLGVDIVPDQSDNGGLDSNGATYGGAAGINWVGAFSGVDLTLAATGAYTKNQGDVPVPGTTDTSGDDQKDWSVGALLGAGGLSFGATFGMNTDFNEGNYVDLGLKYKFGGASASIGWVRWDPDHGETQYVYAISGDVGLLPGVTLKADGTWNTEDPGKHDSQGEDPGNTLAGVMSIQLDY